MTSYDFYVSTKKIKSDTKDCLRGSWKIAAKASIVIFLIDLVCVGITVLLSVFKNWIFSIPLGLISILLLGILDYGYSNFCLKLARQQNPEIKDLFVGFSKRIGSIIKLTLKKFFLYILWFVCLIVPFFVNAIGYSMSTLLMVDRKDINGTNALKESKHIMKQNYPRFAKFVMSYFLWILLLILSAGIGFVWIGPILGTGKAIFYENLKTEF